MAVSFLAVDVSDLCLGKPALRSLSVSATVADALAALKISDESFVSVWSCDHSGYSEIGFQECRCVGKVSVVDVVCYLCNEENLSCPSSVMSSPVSVILPKDSGIVRHVDPQSSLLEAINLILEGAQNLVVPIENTSSSNKSKKKLVQKSSFCASNHNGREFCWLTQEDIVRYFLSSIGFFSPLPALSIESLCIINTTNTLAIGYNEPVSSALNAISHSLIQQTSIAVIDEDGKLIGEISPLTLASCDETVAAAITALSAGDLMAYIDCGGPPDYILQQVKARLRERNLEGMLALLGELPVSSSPPPSASSSDEEPSSVLRSSTRSSKYGKSGNFSARMVRSAEAIVCHPGSSLVAVIMKALAYRVNCIWVIEDDCSLVGIVTFSDILKVFREKLQSIEK